MIYNYNKRKILVLILISVALICASCKNYDKYKSNAVTNEVIKPLDYNIDPVDKHISKESSKDIMKNISKLNNEYKFQYTNNNKSYNTEICYMEVYLIGSEFKENSGFGTFSLMGEKNSNSIGYSIKFIGDNEVQATIECAVGTSSSLISIDGCDKDYKKYEIINDDEIEINENEMYIIGAVLYSENENIEYNKEKILSADEDSIDELSKFDFGFRFKFKLSTDELRTLLPSS